MLIQKKKLCLTHQPNLKTTFLHPPFDEGPMETEEEIAAAYEELYGPAYSGVSFLGKDIYVMDSKVKKLVGGAQNQRKRKLRMG
jgi:small subunit ribosomal protein S5